MKTTTNVGRIAEAKVATYLQALGFKIIDKNWRNRSCEIDIIASKDETIYFVEVKYRRSSNWGKGVDYITNKKLKQMVYASEFWVSENNWSGDYQLAVAEVSGVDFEITNFLNNL